MNNLNRMLSDVGHLFVRACIKITAYNFFFVQYGRLLWISSILNVVPILLAVLNEVPGLEYVHAAGYPNNRGKKKLAKRRYYFSEHFENLRRFVNTSSDVDIELNWVMNGKEAAVWRGSNACYTNFPLPFLIRILTAIIQ